MRRTLQVSFLYAVLLSCVFGGFAAPAAEANALTLSVANVQRGFSDTILTIDLTSTDPAAADLTFFTVEIGFSFLHPSVAFLASLRNPCTAAMVSSGGVPVHCQLGFLTTIPPGAWLVYTSPAGTARTRIP